MDMDADHKPGYFLPVGLMIVTITLNFYLLLLRSTLQIIVNINYVQMYLIFYII